MLTTLAAVQDELPGLTTGLDSYLTRAIAQASTAIDGWCDQTFLRARGVDTVALPLNRTGALRLLLPRMPALTVYSVTIDITGDVIDPTTYAIENGEILYRPLGWSPWSVDQFPNATSGILSPMREVHYLVDYDAGYDDASTPGTPPSPVPADLERACIQLVKAWFFARGRDPYVKSEQNDAGRIDYFVGMARGMPDEVAELIGNYRKLTIA